MQRAHVSEAAEQVAVIEWCDANRVPVFHIPNGGKRGKSEAAYLKRQGVRAGVPDLCVPVARGGYHSLYVEMKVGTNKPTQKQAEWIAFLRKQGMCAYVCYGADAAIECIRRYMALRSGVSLRVVGYSRKSDLSFFFRILVQPVAVQVKPAARGRDPSMEEKELEAMTAEFGCVAELLAGDLLKLAETTKEPETKAELMRLVEILLKYGK